MIEGIVGLVIGVSLSYWFFGRKKDLDTDHAISYLKSRGYVVNINARE